MSINFKNLRSKRVTVMGLGLIGGGVEVVKWLAKQGAKVLVTDLRKEKELKTSLKEIKKLTRLRRPASPKLQRGEGFGGQENITFVLGEHREKDFLNTDLIIKNPAVLKSSKFLKIARDHKIPIASDLSIFFKSFKGKIIGITGTKGKSSTANLVFHIFKNAKQKVLLGGNIGTSPIKYLDDKLLNCSNVKMILELSSWQLEDLNYLKKSPQTAVITTLFPDHLNTYWNFREYLEAKKIIFKYQNQTDTLVLNADDKIVKNLAHQAKAKVFYFSKKELIDKRGVFIKNGKIFWQDKKTKEIISLDQLKTKMPLNNILAAILISLLFKVSPKTIVKTLRNFKGLANRLEFIKNVNGVDYYNDSASTVPEATILALQTLTKPEKTILISGGADKVLDFRKFSQQVKKCKKILLFSGTATPKIEKALRKVKYHNIIKVKKMKEAVQLASRIAEKDDIVLLSPGCASFGVFKNAYDRADQFIKAVKNL